MRSEFQLQMRETLRAAKERLRSKTRGPRKQLNDVTIRQTLWNDEQSDTEPTDN